MINQCQTNSESNTGEKKCETAINQKMKSFGENSSVIRDIFEYGKKRKAEIGNDKVFDFSIGNPSVPCPSSVTESFLRLVSESDPAELHGYTSASGDENAKKKIAQYMRSRYSADVSEDYIYMTCGAAASLAIALKSITEPGDEIIVFTPYFPEYRVFIEGLSAMVVEVPVRTEDFQIDFDALEDAFSEKTKALIINSPNNPTGAVLTEETLVELNSFLKKRCDRAIFVISDEPYRDLVYDKDIPLPMNHIENTIVCYSYSKSLSLPGERIGYIMLGNKVKSKESLFAAICGSGRSLGYVCAPALMQKVIAENQGITSDISIYKENRGILYNALTEYGFEAVYPDGAFYLFLKSPEPDAKSFCQRAKKFEILMVPSDSFGIESYVRISYCVNKDQIENSLSAFRKLAESYKLFRKDEPPRGKLK